MHSFANKKVIADTGSAHAASSANALIVSGCTRLSSIGRKKRRDVPGHHFLSFFSFLSPPFFYSLLFSALIHNTITHSIHTFIHKEEPAAVWKWTPQKDSTPFHLSPASRLFPHCLSPALPCTGSPVEECVCVCKRKVFGQTLSRTRFANIRTLLLPQFHHPSVLSRMYSAFSNDLRPRSFQIFFFFLFEMLRPTHWTLISDILRCVYFKHNQKTLDQFNPQQQNRQTLPRRPNTMTLWLEARLCWSYYRDSINISRL